MTEVGINLDVPMTLHDRLYEMFESQRSLQLSMPPLNKDPAQLEGVERIQFFKDMKLALESELQEMLDEMGWKPWASSRHFNADAVRGELVDVFHFFMNLWLAAGGTADDLFKAYLIKREKNLKRQQQGYDGVSTKCRVCHRALDDDAVNCWMNQDGTEGQCEVDGKEWHGTPFEPTHPVDEMLAGI